MRLLARITHLIRAWRSPHPVEIVIRGGLPDSDPFACATVGGNIWRRAPEESEDEFIDRVREVASCLGLLHVVFGGLPPCEERRQ